VEFILIENLAVLSKVLITQIRRTG
jgi:hypothetical protein